VIQGPAVVDKFATLTQEQQEAYKKTLTEIVQAHMEQGSPIGYEALLLVAVA
jgi:hypothetical protein